MRWPLLLTMLVFTVVTINDAFNNPVPDCGCFGDALIITNWQTLYKNLVINALLLIVFFTVDRGNKGFGLRKELVLTLTFLVAFVAFEGYNIEMFDGFEAVRGAAYTAAALREDLPCYRETIVPIGIHHHRRNEKA